MSPINLNLTLTLGAGGRGVGLLPETKTYLARVTEDSGEILDIKALDADIKALKAIGGGTLWAKLYQLLIAHGGVKRVAGTVCAKWYDIVSTKDVEQTGADTAKPTPSPVSGIWQMDFDGADWLSGAYGEDIAQPYNRIVGVKSNTSTTTNVGGYVDGLDLSGKRGFLGRSPANTNGIRLACGSNLDSDESSQVLPSVLVGLCNGTSSSIFQNGVTLISGNAGTNAVNGINICKNAAADVYSTCSLWFVAQLKSNQLITASEANGLAAWAKSRYGINYTER